MRKIGQKLVGFTVLTIAMFPDDHNPPHFHVSYSGYKATIGINNFALLNGDLPPKTLSLVVEWASLHKQELLEAIYQATKS